MHATNNSDTINSEQALRQIIKSYPKILDKRIQPTLDNYSIEFITQASIAVVAFSDLSLGMPILDLNAGQLAIDSYSTLSFSIPPLAITSALNPDHSGIDEMPCSLYFLIPGVGHGLRINGTAQQIKTVAHKASEIKIALTIQSVYFHCARAITRAELWHKQEIRQHLTTADSIIENSPYVLLATQDALGKTELSPRGDPAGFVKFIDNNHLLLAERPGNKVAVSLTNIINNPAVGLCFLVPGSNNILHVEGKAQLTTNQTLLKPLAIKDKIPKLAILISISSLSLKDSAALKSAQIWKKENHISSKSLTPFSKALTAHMQGEGLLGKLSNPLVSGIIKYDMNNLY